MATFQVTKSVEKVSRFYPFLVHRWSLGNLGNSQDDPARLDRLGLAGGKRRL